MEIKVLSFIDSERRKRIISEFNRNNISFKFYDAFDKNNLDKVPGNFIISPSLAGNDFYNKSKISCALGHIHIIRSSKDSVLICEDDLIISDNLLSSLEVINNSKILGEVAIIFLSLYSHSQEKILLKKHHGKFFKIINPELCASGMAYIVTHPLVKMISAQCVIINGCADDFRWLKSDFNANFYYYDCGFVPAYPCTSTIDYNRSFVINNNFVRYIFKPLLHSYSYFRQYKRYKSSFLEVSK